ncbi:MAG: hypothetical protein AAB352_03045 [Patescibacteria group bacterium]
MELTKCDLCKKIIKEHPIRASFVDYPNINRADLCIECGKPIVDFFKENKLLKNLKNKKS